MVTLLERERSFLFSHMNDLYQNDNYRSKEDVAPDYLLSSILRKLATKTPAFTEKENIRCQYMMEDMRTLYSRQADIRSQHILQGTAGRGSGVGSAHSAPGVGVAAGGADSYFDGAGEYKLANSVLAKLKAGL